MKHKDEAQPLIKHFFSYVSTQFESHIKIFRSDNGGEFLSLQSFFKDNGVLFQHSCVYTPQQNGWWNANTATFYKLHEPLKFKLSSLINFGENAPSPPSISSIAYLHPFSLSKHHLNAFTRNHPLTLTSVCLVVSLMLPVSMFPISSITVSLLVSSLVIPLDKKLINCSIYPQEKYSPAVMYIFMKINFLMLPPSLSSLPLIWAILQAQFLLQFTT